MENIELRTKEHIQSILKKNPVVVFIKGTNFYPYCKFSKLFIHLLIQEGIHFEYVNVMTYQKMKLDLYKLGLKHELCETFPQLWIGGVFIGGLDLTNKFLKDGIKDRFLEKNGALVFPEVRTKRFQVHLPQSKKIVGFRDFKSMINAFSRKKGYDLHMVFPQHKLITQESDIEGGASAFVAIKKHSFTTIMLDQFISKVMGIVHSFLEFVPGASFLTKK